MSNNKKNWILWKIKQKADLNAINKIIWKNTEEHAKTKNTDKFIDKLISSKANNDTFIRLLKK